MKLQSRWYVFASAGLLSLGFAHAASAAGPEPGKAAAPHSSAPATSASPSGLPAQALGEAQRTFGSAGDPAAAFVAALRNHSESDLRAILGPQADRVIDSGDRYADRELQTRFLALYDEKHGLSQTSPGHEDLVVGANDWPLPIPIVESGGKWWFDTEAGAQEIVDRRTGRNELSAIRTLLACEDAQHEYFQRNKQATGNGEYAARFVSTPGHQDGLYWPVAEGESESPLGPLIDAAQEAGYPGELVGGKPIPYEGYYFHILKAQGPDAEGAPRAMFRAAE